MKSSSWIAVVAIVSVMALAMPLTLAQEPQEMSPEEQEMMQKWMAFMTPGESHKMLAERVGTWNYTTKMWQQPGTDPQEFSGTTTSEMIMGGRYLLDNFEGIFMGMPFKGLGITGYDNLNNRVVGMWIDSLGTGITTSTGTCNDDWTVCTYEAIGPDPMTGTNKKSKLVDRKIDADNYVFSMYDTTSDGEEWLAFQMTYKRAP
jgi:hypothetical protein